jgi:hypothetical protein
LILFLEEFCQLYPLQQFLSSSTDSAPAPLPLHENLHFASSIHLLSAIVTYLTSYFLFLSHTYSSASSSFQEGINSLLSSYQLYLHHSQLYLHHCCLFPLSSSPTTTAPTLSPSPPLYSHLLNIQQDGARGGYDLVMIETKSIPDPSQSQYSESILTSPLVGIDREKLRSLLLSSDSPFAEYPAQVEEVSCLLTICLCLTSLSLPLSPSLIWSFRHFNLKRCRSWIHSSDSSE